LPRGDIPLETLQSRSHTGCVKFRLTELPQKDALSRVRSHRGIIYVARPPFSRHGLLLWPRLKIEKALDEDDASMVCPRR
jgi:hypothetical protein